MNKNNVLPRCTGFFRISTNLFINLPVVLFISPSSFPLFLLKIAYLYGSILAGNRPATMPFSCFVQLYDGCLVNLANASLPNIVQINSHPIKLAFLTTRKPQQNNHSVPIDSVLQISVNLDSFPLSYSTHPLITVLELALFPSTR